MNQELIPIPIFHMRYENNKDIIKYVELPKIPLYGRYNPIPREKRVSKITGELFSTFKI